MKYLMVISVAQLACLVLLLVMISGITTTDQDSMAATARQLPEASPAHPASNGDQVAGHAASPGTLDEAQLRRIIRDELGEVLNARRTTATGHEDNGLENGGNRQRNTAEDEYRATFVEQQLEYYKSVGEITPLQMQDLQAEIARLDHADRRQALSNLMRAMNAGEIRGHL